MTEIERTVLDENERFIITPEDIKYLSVKSEDVIAFERELGYMNDEHLATITAHTNAQNGALKQAETVVNDVAGSQTDTMTNERELSTATKSTNVNDSTTTQTTIILESVNNDELFGVHDIHGKDAYVNRKQMKLIFDKLNDGQWRGHFTREKDNGLFDT